HYRWADATLKIGKIDPVTRRITSQEPYWYDGGMNASQGIVYYAFNLLEELDRPGEWYIDRTNGLLYLWPTGDLQQQTVELGVLPSPFITATQLSYVRFDGIVCDLGRFDGIRINGGSDVQLVGCTVRRTAGTGVVVADGLRHILLGCDIHHTGRAAITLNGGDRATLRRADYLVENCHLHHFGRIDRTYTPALQIEGVGMRIAHNLMHDCPSSAIRVDGNDVLFEYNDTHNVVLESDDQGGMESFGNPTFRGLVFRYNRYENIGNGTTMVAGQAAIRFDDVISGMLVYSNLFIRSANGHFGAIQINSGRDNIIDNNVLINCKVGISGGWNPGNVFWDQAKKGTNREFFRNELYLKRYPEMANMLDGKGRNFAWRLALIDCVTPIANRSNFDTFGLGSWTAKDAKFTDTRTWPLPTDSDIMLRLGLRPIPLDEIGLYKDRTRASWPVTTTPATVAK
ncbi:MAG: right-handed parallel beta-helix repeat-containing protein, partial [bacterium]